MGLRASQTYIHMPRARCVFLDDTSSEFQFSFLQREDNDAYFVEKLRDYIGKFPGTLMAETFY